MSCFAVSRLAGKVGRHKMKEGSPPPPPNSNAKCTVGSPNGSGHKRRSNVSSVEIVQEIAIPRESSLTPIPPSSPQPSPFHHYQQRHMSPHRGSVNGSVPPSPALSGCRSPSRQRKQHNYSTLEVQNAALAAMKEEVMELAARLTHMAKERDYMEKALNRIQLEKLRLAKEKDDQLDCQSARYEERLIELHSVIAELSRQVEQKNREQIAEDSEGEEEEDAITSSAQHDSVAVASRTSTDIDAQAVEAGQRLAAQLAVGGSGSDLCAFLRLSRSSASHSLHNSSTTSLQVLALQEELSDAKERNVQMAARLQQREADLNEARKELEEAAKEKEQMRQKVCVLEEKLIMAPALSPTRAANNSEPTDKMELQIHTKMAERKRIKKSEEELDNGDNDTDDGEFGARHPVTGSDLLSVGVRSSVVAEHLVQDLQDKSSMQEFSYSFANPSDGQHGGAGKKQDHHRRSVLLESKLQEFEIEMERLSSRIEHLKSQNDVLNLTLAESKNHCDNLTVLIGKYESNHTAQQLVINNVDHILESLEVLVALLETEMGVVLANCKASGLTDMVVSRSNCEQGQGGSVTDQQLIDRAVENRQAAEKMARRLLKSLDSVIRPDSGLAMPSTATVFNGGTTGSGGGAWEDSSGYSQTTSSASPSIGSNNGCGMAGTTATSFVFTSQYVQHGDCLDPSRPEEVRLRDCISQLKTSRSSIQSTITELESLHSEDDRPPAQRVSANDARTADLEMAVLVQELMAMREEKGDLRAQVYLMEREKKSLELVISSQQAQERALKTHIQHLQEELENQESLNDFDTEASFQNRNVEMKSRITELLTTLEKVKRNSELRQQQSEELIKDLKKTNGSLTEAMDRIKKKYQSRLKRMEQQILQSLLHQNPLETSTSSHQHVPIPSDMESSKYSDDTDETEQNSD